MNTFHSVVPFATISFSEVLGSCNTETPCFTTPVSLQLDLSHYDQLLQPSAQTHFHTFPASQKWNPAFSSSGSLRPVFQAITFTDTKSWCPICVFPQTNSGIFPAVQKYKANFMVEPNQTLDSSNAATTSLMPR